MDDQRPGAGLHKRRHGNAPVEHPPKKRRSARPCFCYQERDDGKPPQMSLLHVNFAQLCVDSLRQRPDLTTGELIERFNASEYSNPEQYHRELRRGQKGSGKADHFFCNGYFRIQQLKDMAAGTLPLPVPLQTDRKQQAATGDAGGHGRSPASPAPASAGRNSRESKRRPDSPESHRGDETANSSSSSEVQKQPRRRRRGHPGIDEIEQMRNLIDADSDVSDSELEQRMWDAAKHDPAWRAKLDKAVDHYLKAKTRRNN